MKSMTIVLLLLLLPLFFVGGLFALFRLRMRGLPKPPRKKPEMMLKPREWKDDEVTVGWVGHSTVLMNLYGTVIMTDPVLGERVGIHLGVGEWQVGLSRHTEPALSLQDLERVDLILLSHAHFDHFDLPSLKKLARPETWVITAKGTSRLLRNLPFGRVIELGGEEEVELKELGIRVRAVPVKHWGNRFPWNKGYGYTGYLVEKKGTRLFYAGDTAYTSTFRKLRELGEIDLVFMPIGAYQPYVWTHCTPEQAWNMFVDTGAKWLVPIHWNTFVLSYEPVDEPILRLREAAGAEAGRIVLSRHGEVFRFSKAEVNIV